jgi:hypothetical protein
MPYTGQCHCGAVEFTVGANLPATAISCNCSHCRAKGLILTFVPAAQFTLVKGDQALAEHRFNTRKIAHKFCTNCGTQPFAEGQGPQGAVRAINLRCVPEADLDAIKLDLVDGASN